MFTLAVERGNTEVTMEVMKTLSQFPQEKLITALEIVPLEDLMW